MCKKISSGSFKSIINKMGLQFIYIFNIYALTGFGINSPTRVD